MAETLQISKQAPSSTSQDYEALRKEGLSLIQKLGEETWTDHNIHDPGITLIEALSYALTECGLRASMDLTDILATSALQHAPEYHTAANVLPCSPIHADDFRKILIDHPLVHNARCFPMESFPRGQLSVLLEFENAILNSNTYQLIVTPGGLTRDYIIEIAFPHWDDEEVQSIQQDVLIQNVVFDGTPADIWNPIEGTRSYFARATVTIQILANPPDDIEIWVVTRINTEMEDAALEAPQILDEITIGLSAVGDNSPADQTLLKQLNRRVTEANQTMRMVRRYIHGYRNLCEEFQTLNASRIQEIGISAIIEVGGGVNIESFLAEMFLEIDEQITCHISFTSLADSMQKAGTAELVFEGPMLDHGFLSISDESTPVVTGTVYTSDILRIIYQLRNSEGGDLVRREEVAARSIVAVREVRLSNYLDNRPVTVGARDCLHLVDSRRHIPQISISKSHIVIYRNGIEIEYDGILLKEIFDDLKSNTTVPLNPKYEDLNIPIGESFTLEKYYPVQNDLPIIYGVGEAGLPDNASVMRRAQARQLKGYLLHFEHVVSGFHSQFDAFNSFFSADASLAHTMVRKPLYHLPEIADILLAFQPGIDDWEVFINDPSNGYAQFLETGLETREQFLKKRNAILDHLLANIGEEMQSRTALLFRLANSNVNAEALSLPELLDAQHLARLNALEDLIVDKSQYYYDLPAIDAARSQAFGNPLWRNVGTLQIEKTTGGYTWAILILGNPVFQLVNLETSIPDVRRAAELTIKLATVESNYFIRNEGGGIRRLELRPQSGADAIGESVTTFNSNALAQIGRTDTTALSRDFWFRKALSPLECRLFHLLGIEPKERRLLIHPIGDFVEIFDEVDADAIIEKRFRLWEQPGFAGSTLLASTGNYPGATDPEAIALANVAVHDLILRGINKHNYRIENVGGSFLVGLTGNDGVVFADSPQIFNTLEEAQNEIQGILTHLNYFLRAEGFYCIEHHLLFPDTLELPETDISIDDLYSFQMTFILPSGFSQDFSIAEDLPVPAEPVLYQSLEFRKYGEEEIRKHCPAHILPRILWVDRATAGTVVNPTDPSFDNFESAYHAWLNIYLIDEPDENVLAPLRSTLAARLTDLYDQYYS